MNDVMVKVPSCHPTVFYRYESGTYRIKNVMNVVIVREVLPVFNLKTPKNMHEMVQHHRHKLANAPCLVMQNNEDFKIFNCTKEITQKSMEDFAWLDGVLVQDDDYYFVNYNTYATVYIQDNDNRFMLSKSFDLFCTTMMVPSTMNETMIPSFQAHRSQFIEKQLNATRIVLGLNSEVYYYNAFNMSHIKTFYSQTT